MTDDDVVQSFNTENVAGLAEPGDSLADQDIACPPVSTGAGPCLLVAEPVCPQVSHADRGSRRQPLIRSGAGRTTWATNADTLIADHGQRPGERGQVVVGDQPTNHIQDSPRLLVPQPKKHHA